MDISSWTNSKKTANKLIKLVKLAINFPKNPVTDKISKILKPLTKIVVL